MPDIRVVVYRGYPAMAMVRLPTRASDGKANLHQGAVGAGVDMSSGETLTGVLDNEIVDEHPDTGALVTGLMIPQWDFILQTSARGYEVTGLGYLGVDMVVDADKGPMILEMNARPGLNIQIANCTGLTTRIARIDEIYDEKASLRNEQPLQDGSSRRSDKHRSSSDRGALRRRSLMKTCLPDTSTHSVRNGARDELGDYRGNQRTDRRHCGCHIPSLPGQTDKTEYGKHRGCWISSLAIRIALRTGSPLPTIRNWVAIWPLALKIQEIFQKEAGFPSVAGCLTIFVSTRRLLCCMREV